MRSKVKTTPDLSVTSETHQAAMAAGNDHFRLWARNVIDEFKNLTEKEIKAKLHATAFPYAVCFENWINDFNLSSGIRNANAFNAKEVFYLGNKKIDRRALCGVHNYTEIQWLPTIEEFIKLKEKYIIIGVDNVERAIPIQSHKWENNTLVVFGSEGVGLTLEMQSMCDKLVYMPQYGSVRSLNCATASGIVMFDIVNQFNIVC
jgi:tRNA G18 (ribose-2'-O)-methylase SpoU